MLNLVNLPLLKVATLSITIVLISITALVVVICLVEKLKEKKFCLKKGR